MAKHTTNSGKRLALGLMAVFGLSAGWAAPGEAVPIAFTFTATFTQAGVEVPITGSYTFESTTVDRFPTNPFSGAYESPSGAPYGYSVTVQGVTMFGHDALLVTPPPLGPFGMAQVTVQFPGGDTQNFVTGILRSLTCSAGCGANPDPGPTPDPTPVPEPGTLLLLTPGLAFLSRVRQHIGARTKRMAIALAAVIGVSTGWAASSEAAPMTYNFEGSLTLAFFAPGDPYQATSISQCWSRTGRTEMAG